MDRKTKISTEVSCTCIFPALCFSPELVVLGVKSYLLSLNHCYYFSHLNFTPKFYGFLGVILAPTASRNTRCLSWEHRIGQLICGWQWSAARTTGDGSSRSRRGSEAASLQRCLTSRQKPAHRFAESGYERGYVFELCFILANNPSKSGLFSF